MDVLAPRGFVAVVAAAVALSLSGCASQPATIDTAYGVGTAVYWDDGTLSAIKFPDGSVGWPTADGKVLSSVYHPNGEVTFYEDDGSTVAATWVSDNGASLTDGRTTTKDSMATMGSEFTLTSGGGDSVVSGVPLGVVASSPVTDGDPGRCFVIYFSFRVESFTHYAENPVSVYAPQPDYVVSGEEVFSHELYPDIDDRHFGLCDAAWRTTGPWQYDFSEVEVGETYYSAEDLYLPEGSSLDGIMIGYWEGRRVHYAPTMLEGPPTLASAGDW